MKALENITFLGFNCTIKTKIDISIIIPTYNHALYIRQCLDSVLSQKISSTFEIIIHDDASQDNTQTIIMEYFEKYPLTIKAILQHKNQYSQHQSIFRKIVPYISGNYIAICEGDDYWISNDKLQRQLNFLNDNREFLAVYHRAMIVNKDGEFTKKVIPLRLKKKEFSLVDYKNNKLPGQTGSLFYRNIWTTLPKDLLEAFWNCKGVGDRKTSLLLTLLGRVYCLPEIMSAYRYERESGSSWSAINNGKNNFQYFHESLNEMNQFSELYFNVKIKTFKREISLMTDSFIFFLKSKNLKDWEIFKNIFYHTSFPLKHTIFIMAFLVLPFRFTFRLFQSLIKNVYQQSFISMQKTILKKRNYNK